MTKVKHRKADRPQNTFKRKLTEEQFKMVIAMAGYGMPYGRIADILGMKTDAFTRLRKQHDTLQTEMDKARAGSSALIHRTLYDMATKQGKKQFDALKFWCQTREGFKSAERVELTGPDGAPIESVVMTSEQRRQAIRELDERLKISDDE